MSSYHSSTFSYVVDHQQSTSSNINLQSESFTTNATNALPFSFYRSSMNLDIAFDTDNFPPLPQPQRFGAARSSSNLETGEMVFRPEFRNGTHEDADHVSTSVAPTTADQGLHVRQSYVYAEMGESGGLNVFQAFDQKISVLPPSGVVAETENNLAADVENAFNNCQREPGSSGRKSRELVKSFDVISSGNLNMERRAVGNGRPAPRASLENTSNLHSPISQNGDNSYPYAPTTQFSAVNQHFNSVTIAPSNPVMASVSTQTDSRFISDRYEMDKMEMNAYLSAKVHGGVYQLWFIPDADLMLGPTNSDGIVDINSVHHEMPVDPLWLHMHSQTQLQTQTLVPGLSTSTTANFTTEFNLCNTFNSQVNLNREQSELNGFNYTDGFSQILNMASHGFPPMPAYSDIPSEINNAGFVNGTTASPLAVMNGNHQYEAPKQIRPKFDAEQERNWKSVMSALGIGDCPSATQGKESTHNGDGSHTTEEYSERNVNGKINAVDVNHGFPKKFKPVDFNSNGDSYASSSHNNSGKYPSWNNTGLSTGHFKDPFYSTKIFVGGLGALTELCKHDLRKGFQKFDVVDVAWCTRDNGLIRGCAYVTFRNRHQIERLIRACRPLGKDDEVWNGRKLQYDMPYSGQSIRVDVILWDTLQSTYFCDRVEGNKLYDDRYSVFVGNLHGLITARDLANIFIDKGFLDVKSVHITLDKSSYPTGFAKVVFTSFQTFVFAIKTKNVAVEMKEFNRCLQVEPYIEGNKCCCCNVFCASLFCKSDDCLRYYCPQCSGRVHSAGSFIYHQLIVRDRRSNK